MSGRRLLLPKLHSNVRLSDADARRIREATGLKRGFRDGELLHWLREAARSYHVNATSQLPWQRVNAHGMAISAAAKRLKALLQAPETADCFGQSRSSSTGIQGELERLIQTEKSAREARRVLRARVPQNRWGPDCILIGGHLPFIFQVLYGRGNKGEGRGFDDSAPYRFVAACCRTLGLNSPRRRSWTHIVIAIASSAEMI